MKKIIDWLMVIAVLNVAQCGHLRAQSTNTQLYGRVILEDGTPITTTHVLATSFDGTSYGQFSISNGFCLAVGSGQWNISIDNLTTALPSYLQPTLPFFACSGQSSNLVGDIVLRHCSGVITGKLIDSSNAAIVGVQVICELTVGDLNYYANGCTDSNGCYRVSVCNGLWTILFPGLTSLNFSRVTPQSTLVSNSTNQVNFSTQKTSSLEIVTTNLPTAYSEIPYDVDLTASGGVPPYQWSLVSNTLPSGLILNSDGSFSGAPSQLTNCTFSVSVLDNLAARKTNLFSLNVAFPLIVKLATVNNQTQLYLIGETNKRYTIESSDVMTSNWTPIASNWSSGALLTLSNWAGDQERFFRAHAE
jgi:hypothetical protein